MFNMKSKNRGTFDKGAQRGNTKKLCRKSTRQRARSWCFTWNNYTEKSVAHLVKAFSILESKKYIFQEEIGENKTPHLQGVVSFNNAIEFNTMKHIDEKIHWEKCINLKASIRYCSKKETRSGDLWKKGIEDNELWKKPKKIRHLSKQEIYDNLHGMAIEKDFDNIVAEMMWWQSNIPWHVKQKGGFNM